MLLRQSSPRFLGSFRSDGASFWGLLFSGDAAADGRLGPLFRKVLWIMAQALFFDIYLWIRNFISACLLGPSYYLFGSSFVMAGWGRSIHLKPLYISAHVAVSSSPSTCHTLASSHLNTSVLAKNTCYYNSILLLNLPFLSERLNACRPWREMSKITAHENNSVGLKVLLCIRLKLLAESFKVSHIYVWN
jgi:hypothetical protein